MKECVQMCYLLDATTLNANKRNRQCSTCVWRRLARSFYCTPFHCPSQNLNVLLLRPSHAPFDYSTEKGHTNARSSMRLPAFYDCWRDFCHDCLLFSVYSLLLMAGDAQKVVKLLSRLFQFERAMPRPSIGHN